MTRDGFAPSDGAAKLMKPDEKMNLDLVYGRFGKRGDGADGARPCHQ